MSKLTPEEIARNLQDRFGADRIELMKGSVGQPWIQLAPEMLPPVALALRYDPAFQFDVLMCLSGLHYDKENELGVVYNLDSTTLRHTINLKVRVPLDHPHIPSLERLWKTANWHEREAFDMVGIIFDNHPDLRRILTPDDWEGHALRKDYVQQDFYQGIPTK